MDDDRKAKQHAYYLAHPEIWKKLHDEQKERYANDPEFRKRRQASYDRYAADNPDKIRDKNKRMKNNRRSKPTGKLDYILRNARHRAQKRGIPFDDALIDLAKAPPTHCPCCGDALDYRTGLGQSPLAPSLDRLVAALGYIVGNVDIICMRCNAIKNDGTADEHRRIADYIDRCLRQRSTHS